MVPVPERDFTSAKSVALITAQCVDRSLKRRKLERIDFYQLHRIDRKVPVEESLGALKKAQDAAKSDMLDYRK